MKTIWKWKLEITDNNYVKMPENARILTVQLQYDVPMIWALVDTVDKKESMRTIHIYGTGNPLPDNPGKYISTFQLFSGDLIFHVFEEDNEPI